MKELKPLSPISLLEELKSRPIFQSSCSLKALIDYHTNDKIGEESLISDFRILKKTDQLDELSNDRLGKKGENACFLFLNEFFKAQSVKQPKHIFCEFKVNHLNSNNESFKPYDIEIENIRGWGSNCKLFVDVKTTRKFENSFFHISISEASFINENFDNYIFGRVFPLAENKRYYGIRIANSWGVIFCRLHNKYRPEFETALNELKYIDQGEGFLIKTEWLVNISLNAFENAKKLDAAASLEMFRKAIIK